MSSKIRKIFAGCISVVVFTAMTATVSAADYNVTDIEIGDKIHHGDIIKYVDGTPFTVLDGNGNYWHNADVGAEIGGTAVYPLGDDREWLCFESEGSSYKIVSLYGFYAYDITHTLEHKVSYNPNTPKDSDDYFTLKAICLDPGNYTINYTINYDANGGEGVISPTGWEYLDSSVSLSDGAGFTRDGYSITGWCIAPDGDENGDGIVDEHDGILTDSAETLGAALDLSQSSLAQNIPLYATSTDDSGSTAAITLYAVWAETSAELTGEPEPEPTEPLTPDKPLDDSPKAGDDTPVSVLLAIMAMFTACTAFVGIRKRI